MSDHSMRTAEMHNWLDRINAGDRLALNSFLKRVSGRLERLARKLMKRFPRIQRWTDAEDVLQNATLRLIRSLQDIRPNSMRDFYGLAATQMRRELLDVTKSLYGPQGEGANHDSVMGKSGSEQFCVEPVAQTEDVVELEKWCRFHLEVEKLPSEEREVVGLIYYHGWSQADVAELFDVSVRTVQRWWQAAIHRLRSVLSDLPKDPPGSGLS